MYAPLHTIPRRRRFRPAAWTLAALLLTASAATAGEHWYQVELAGQPAGWVVEREELRGGEVVTESKTRLELSRGQVATAIEMESRFVESPDGQPLSAWTKQKLGAMPIEASYEFRAGAVVVRRQQNGSAREQSVPPPEGDWLTPRQAQKRILEQLADGAEDFSIRSLELLLGLEPVTTRWMLEARDQEVATDHGVYRTTRWRQTQSYAPAIATVAHVDDEGRMIRSVTSMMGMEMTVTLSERETVMEEPSAAPELLVQSFIRPNREIERPRRTRRAVYEIRTADGTVPDLPSLGAQTVGSDGRLTVELGSSPRLESVDAALYLRSTTYLPHDDPAIRDLLARAAGNGEDAGRAETLRSFVAAYLVEKNLDTVLATASEVATTRSGDCTEHAVLLAALLRAAEIPSRVVSGLIYVERFAGHSEIFSFHMWTQALLEDRWIDLDATLPSRFDASHIALAATALDDGGSALREMTRIVPLMGRTRIEVVDVDYTDGKP